MKIIRRLGWVAAAATYFLVVLGGIVRVNDAGLSCPDWPLCYGKVYSPNDAHTFLEQFHRYVAGSVVSISIIALTVLILLWARHEKRLLIPAILAPIFLAVQIVLGGLTVL